MRVIYLDIDSLRADHLGSYGYGRDTSPAIDALAAKGAVLTSVYASSSPCMPSRASLVTGRFGIRHGVLSHWGAGSALRFAGQGHRYDDYAPSFLRYLRKHGYTTVSFSSFLDRHQAFWFGAGWSEMHTFTLKGGDETADEVNAAALPWLREHGREHEDLFLHLQYWDPHRDYRVSPSWVERLGDAGRTWLTDDVVSEHLELTSPYSPAQLFPFRPDNSSPTPVMPDRIASARDAAHLMDGYDAAIRFLDDQIAMLLETLAEIGILEDTAIVISADHGESLGEGGVYGDHVSAAEPVHRVPMIVYWPGATRGLKDGLRYQLDLLPTIVEMLGLPVPDGWDGVSFAPALRGEPDPGRPWLVWDHGLYACQRAVRTKQWLYQRTYHPGLFQHTEQSLWAIADDTHQQHDVADNQPAVIAQLDDVLSAWRSDALDRSVGVDPLDEIIGAGGPYRYFTPDRWADRLRNQGRDRAATATEMVAATRHVGPATTT